MVLAYLGSLSLSRDHPHEIMRLRVRRGDPYSIACVIFGFRQRALVEQEQRERLRRRQIVWIEPHHPSKQRLDRRWSPLRRAKLVKQRERATVRWRPLEQLDESPLCLRFVACRKRGARGTEVHCRSGLGQGIVQSSPQQRA